MSKRGPAATARRKMRRAEHFIDTLEATIQRYFAGPWCTSRLERTGQNSYHLRIEVHGEPADVDMMVGDAVHNMRTALDHLAVSAVVANGRSEKRVMFPFANNEPELDSMIRDKHFDRASPAIQAKLRALQPYYGGNDRLRALHDLDIQDKHHSLITNASSVTSPSVRVRTDSSGKPTLIGDALELEIDPASRPTAVFTFAADSTFAGQEIVSTLRSLHSMVMQIIEDFESAF